MLKSLILAGASLMALSTTAIAADQTQAIRPMFARGVGGVHPIHAPVALTTWKFSYTYSGKKYADTFVGTDPKGGASTTVPTYIIPIALTYKTTTTDPTAGGTTSPLNLTVASPIFDATTDYKQGKTDVGATQYVDAFQRAALWGKVKKKPGYHVLLGAPTIEPLQSFTIPTNKGGTGTGWGVNYITADINWFDAQISALLSTLKIPANSLPIFLTTQTYLTSGGCCIGGYHNYTGTQAYSHATYIVKTGGSLAFAQDVSALSHEVSEWMDDPLINNSNTPAACSQQGNHNSLYEVGDPTEVLTNFGNFPYTLNGFVYHLQDEVLPPYFGAPAKTSANGWMTFQGHSFTVCQNGG